MLTEENLSSCYISNLSFFNHYISKKDNENNIYGLTGTIGSEYNIKTLKELYNLRILYIPPFKKSKLIIEKPIIILSNEKKETSSKIGKKDENINDLKKKWENEIINKAIKLVKSNRSVLIICQYIRDVDKMYNIFANLKESNKLFQRIFKYSRSDISSQSKFLENNIIPKILILSTNISGRGTDIKISSELNKNKGLHVILTFEPFNERIERQAFGRAARKGQNGSSGKIILSPFTEEEIYKEINKREKEESDFLINVYKEKITVFEKIFNNFSKFLENICKTYNLNKVNKNENDVKGKDHEILLLDLKERWGLFLIENNLNSIEKKYKEKHSSIKPEMFKEIEDNYKKFEIGLRIYSFNTYLEISNINNSNKEQYKFKNALYLNKSLNAKHIELAIEADSDFALGSYMFFLKNNIDYIIKKYGIIYENSINYENDNKKRIYLINLYFDKLINILNSFVNQYNLYQELLLKICIDKNSDIIKQNLNKRKLMENVLDLMKQNKNEFDDYIKNINSNVLNYKEFTVNELLLAKKLCLNKLEKDYFLDFGFRLFILQSKSNNENCIIY